MNGDIANGSEETDPIQTVGSRQKPHDTELLGGFPIRTPTL